MTNSLNLSKCRSLTRREFYRRARRILSSVLLGLIVKSFTFGVLKPDEKEITWEWFNKRVRPVTVEMSPDGQTVLYSLTHVTSGSITGGDSLQFFLYDVRTRKSVLLTNTNGLDRDSALVPVKMPHWHPDGKHFVYLSTAGGHTELWTSDLDGRNERQLSGLNLAGLGLSSSSFSQYAVQRSGNFIATVRLRQGGIDNSPWDKPGFLAGDKNLVESTSENRAVFGYPWSQTQNDVITLINTATGKEEILNNTLLASVNGITGLHWSPDGKKLMGITNVGGFTWSEEGAKESNIFVIDIATKSATRPVNTPNYIDWFAQWSPDGTAICDVVNDNLAPQQYGSAVNSIWTFANGQLTRLIDGLYASQPFWSPFDGKIYFANLENSTRRLVRVRQDGTLEHVSPEGLSTGFGSFSFSMDGSRVAAIMSNATTPTEVYIGNLRDGKFEKITSTGDQYRDQKLGPVEFITWPSGDGRFTDEGFLVKPPNYDPRKKYPLILDMHGGPAGTWENNFEELNFSNRSSFPQLLAQAGYVVFLPNPRGDHGYPVEYQRALIGHLGDDVRYDCIAGVDYLIKQGIADPGRLAVMGGSYGAISTFYAIEQTTRFKAAIADEGLSNFIRYRINEMPNYYDASWQEYYMGGRIHETTERWWGFSPIKNASLIRTPLLMRTDGTTERGKTQVAEHMDMYYALEKNGVPAEVLAYPGEGHGIVRPKAVQDFFRRRLAWLDYWVLDKPYPNTNLQKRFDAYKARMKNEGIWRD